MFLAKPRAILFDWDNTLVDTWPVIHAALAKTFTDMGQTPWTLEETMRRVRKSMRDSFPALFGPRWEEAGALYQRYYRASHLSDLAALQYAVPLLARIRESGLFCAVVSNKKGDTLREEVTHLGWNDYFDALVGSGDAARDKPHADPVTLALRGAPVIAGPEVWFVGDSEIDLECADITGCTAILYGLDAASHSDFTPTHFQGFPYHAYAADHRATLKLLHA